MPEAMEADRVGSVVIGGRRISVRTVIFWAGVTFWLGNMIVYTGWYGVAELRASLYFVLELILITSATRTIGLERVPVFYCWGGTMMGVMILISAVYTSFVPSPDAVSRQFFVPLMEESLKLAPVAFMVWRERKSRLWSMSASDIMLLAATTGAGFGLVEEAFFHLHVGPSLALDLFPLTRINGPTLTVGHGSWTGLAGATLGLALLLRPPKPLNYLLAVSGILWSIADHSHHNYGIDRSGWTVEFFNWITGHGWFALYFFILSAIAVIAADLYALHWTLPPRPEFRIPIDGLLLSRKGPKSVWNFILAKRALALVGFHYRQEPPAVRSDQLDPILYSLCEKLATLRDENKSRPGVALQASPDPS